MTKGFADQPIGGGIIERLNSKNTDMTANRTGFIPAPLFANANGGIFSPVKSRVFLNLTADDCAPNEVFKSGKCRPTFADDMFGTGLSLKDAFNTALGFFNANNAAQVAAQQRGDAKELARLQIEQTQNQIKVLEAQAALEKEKAGGKTNYTIPILVTGGVIILGIGAYFIFRKMGK